MRMTAGWPVKTSTCAPTTPSWAQKTLWGEPIQKVVTRRFAHCMLSPLFDRLNLNIFDCDWDNSVICSISSEHEMISMIWCFVMLYDYDGNDETSGLSVSSSPPVKKSSPTATIATLEFFRARLKCLPLRWGWWWWWWLNDGVGDHSHPHLHHHPPPYPCFDKT